MVRFSSLFALLCVVHASAAAQAPGAPYGEMQSALEAAQAGANRAGDESLDCEALSAELVATVQQPAVQSYVARSGAEAQTRAAALKSASAGAAAQSALTLFGSLVPGGAWLGHTVGAAQAQAQQAQAAGQIEQRMRQAREMMSIMPQLARGQRIIELAQARNCAWISESMAR